MVYNVYISQDGEELLKDKFKGKDSAITFAEYLWNENKQNPYVNVWVENYKGKIIWDSDNINNKNRKT